MCFEKKNSILLEENVLLSAQCSYVCFFLLRCRIDKKLALVCHVVLYYQPVCGGDCDALTQRAVVCYLSFFCLSTHLWEKVREECELI